MRFPKAASHLLLKEGSTLGAKLFCAISYISCQVSLIGSAMIAVWSYLQLFNETERWWSKHGTSLLSGDWIRERMRLL